MPIKSMRDGRSKDKLLVSSTLAQLIEEKSK